MLDLHSSNACSHWPSRRSWQPNGCAGSGRLRHELAAGHADQTLCWPPCNSGARPHAWRSNEAWTLCLTDDGASCKAGRNGPRARLAAAAAQRSAEGLGVRSAIGRGRGRNLVWPADPETWHCTVPDCGDVLAVQPQRHHRHLDALPTDCGAGHWRRDKSSSARRAGRGSNPARAVPYAPPCASSSAGLAADRRESTVGRSACAVVVRRL